MNLDHRCKQCMPRIGVVIPARNEQDNIYNTLSHLMKQTLQPVQIIVVDDGSTDNTYLIASQFPVQVVKFPVKHESWVIAKELALVFNYGLEMLDRSLDYVTVVGGDDMLPSNYLEHISTSMSVDDVVIASGRIKHEYNTIPRGSGRLVDWKWWQSVGGKYPVNYGYESWLIGKCRETGKKMKVYDNIESNVQRPTSTNYRDEMYYHRGQAYKALGYNKRFVLCRAIVMIFKHKKPYATYRMLKAFFFAKDVQMYEDGVQKYYRELQNHQCSIRNIPWMIKRYMELTNKF